MGKSLKSYSLLIEDATNINTLSSDLSKKQNSWNWEHFSDIMRKIEPSESLQGVGTWSDIYLYYIIINTIKSDDILIIVIGVIIVTTIITIVH